MCGFNAVQICLSYLILSKRATSREACGSSVFKLRKIPQRGNRFVVVVTSYTENHRARGTEHRSCVPLAH